MLKSAPQDNMRFLANFYQGRTYEGTDKVIYRGHCPFLHTKPLIK